MQRSRRHRRHVCAAPLPPQSPRSGASGNCKDSGSPRIVNAARTPFSVGREQKRAPRLSSSTGAAPQISHGLWNNCSGHHKLQAFAPYGQDVNARLVCFESHVCLSGGICVTALQQAAGFIAQAVRSALGNATDL